MTTSTPPHSQARHRRRTRTFIALAILLGVAATGTLAVALQWGDRSVVLLSFAAVIALVVLLVDWAIARFGPGVWRVLSSLARSLARAVQDDPEVRRIARAHPRFSSWLGRRTTLRSASGLYLTVTVLLALYFLSGFAEIAVNVGLARAITHYDPQIEALVRAFRSPGFTRVFYAATLFGNLSAFVPLVLVGVVLLVMWAKRREAVLFAGTIASGYAIGELAKVLFERARPPAEYALIHQPSSYSFPSGHALASGLFAVTLAFILLRITPHPRRRVAILTACLGGAVLVGLSRIYLGVHWPSDVLASWLLALGWCTITCGGFLILERYGAPAPEWKAWFRERMRWPITSTAAAIAALLVAFAGLSDPLVGQITAPAPAVVWQVTTTQAGLPEPTAAQVAQLPIFSEKLDGSHQEPIGIIFIGSEKALVSAFRTAGWDVADRPSLVTLTNTGIAALRNRPYPTAPVTPTFLGGNVQDLAFEKEGSLASARQRHHTRFWRTRFTFDGEPVWVATASFDSRLEIATAIPVPTHHIDPDIDAERNFIVGDLTGVGVTHVEDVRVTPPLSGTNAQGDVFFTQGMAALLIAPR